MTLTRRLLISYLGIVAVTGVTLIVAADRMLRQRLVRETTVEMEREARLLAASSAGVRGDSLDRLIHELGDRTGRRLTIIDRKGDVVADSYFPHRDLESLENHSHRPEIIAAYAGSTGVNIRTSVSTGRPELKVAVPLGRDGGVARISSPLVQVDAVVWDAQQAVLLGGLLAAVVAVLLSWGFSERVARPLVRLSGAAQRIAQGEHPALDTRGRDEIGEMARALQTVDENLSARLDQLARERGETDALIASMVEGVLACDAAGRVRTANPAARRLLGLGPDAPLPTATELLRQRAAQEAVQTALKGGTVTGREIAVDTRTVHLSGRGLPGGGAVFALHDITELKRLEAVRRDFVANVSHELKTPLTVVRGYAETLAKDDTPPDTRRQFVDTMLANARRMQRLIDDLLDLSRIESGAWIPAPGVVTLEPAARDIWSGLKHSARLVFAIDPDAAQVAADPDAVRQILTNILDNAARYTPPSGQITVAAKRAGDRVAIAVTDTGSGIPGEHLPRIFERFYRADPHRSREAGGTGLGLAIVKHLVEAHGGRVEAASTLGQGTTIRLTLPAAD